MNYNAPQTLVMKNPHLRLNPLDGETFRPYGRIIHLDAADNLIRIADSVTEIPEKENIYEPSTPELETKEAIKQLEVFYGGMQIQIGYCNGNTSSLNGLEYHNCPETILAVTDFVLLLGRQKHLENFARFDTRHVEAFYIPKGAQLMLCPRVLHLAPSRVHSNGFKAIIILERGTNLELPCKPQPYDNEARILFKRNKWMIAHKERTILTSQGVLPYVVGSNITVAPMD